MMYIENGDKNMCSITILCEEHYTSHLTRYYSKQYPFDRSIICMRNLTRFIYEDLVNTYNYGKQWTVFVSPYFCKGRKSLDVTEVEIGDFKVTVYFSNPVKAPVIPFEEINDILGSKINNFFSMFHPSNKFCPMNPNHKTELMNSFYEKVNSYGYCNDREFCAACAGTASGYVTDNNVDIKLFAPCVYHRFTPLIMGPRHDEQLQYPPDDKFNKTDPLAKLWTPLNKFTKLISECRMNNNVKKCIQQNKVKKLFKKIIKKID